MSSHFLSFSNARHSNNLCLTVCADANSAQTRAISNFSATIPHTISRPIKGISPKEAPIHGVTAGEFSRLSLIHFHLSIPIVIHPQHITPRSHILESLHQQRIARSIQAYTSLYRTIRPLRHIVLTPQNALPVTATQARIFATKLLLTTRAKQLPHMYPFHDPYQNPYYTSSRGVSPPRNDAERPRRGYYPGEYGRVSPLSRSREPGFPDFSNLGPGYENMHYPRGSGRRYGGFWKGGAPREWEHWR